MTEEYLTLAEIKELLQKEKEARTLSLEQNYALEHAARYAKLDAKDARELVGKLLKIERMTEPLACKIVDIMPKYPEEVKTIFLKERQSITDEMVDEILDKVREYL